MCRGVGACVGESAPWLRDTLCAQLRDQRSSDSHIVFVRPRRTSSDIYTNPCANIFYHIRLPTMHLLPIRICLAASVSDTRQLSARTMLFGEKKRINIRSSVSIALLSLLTP